MSRAYGPNTQIRSVWCWRMARKPQCPYSGGRPVIIVQHSAQALSPLDRTGGSQVARLWLDQAVVQALMMAFFVIMSDELGKGGPQRLFSEQNQAVQAGLLDTPDESLGERI
jgi:hypothetical protein